MLCDPEFAKSFAILIGEERVVPPLKCELNICPNMTFVRTMLDSGNGLTSSVARPRRKSKPCDWGERSIDLDRARDLEKTERIAHVHEYLEF